MRHSMETLWAFVARADTIDKIESAVTFLSRQAYIPSNAFSEMVSELKFRKHEIEKAERLYNPEIDFGEQLTFD